MSHILLHEYSEDDEPNPSELSGDENTQKSVDKKGPDRKANLLLTVTTIIKTVIGAGILSFPFTFSRLGYVFGILMFFVIIVLTQFTCNILMKSKNLSRHSNFSTIIYYVFPNRIIQLLPSIAIFSANFGVCIIQLMILKDGLKQVIDQLIETGWVKDQFYTSPTFIVLVISVLQIRFILVKKIQNYKFIAFIGVCGVSAFVLALIIVFILEMNKRHKCSPDFKPFENNFTEIVSVLPNYIFSFTYQWNFFPIYKGMKNVSDKRFVKASILGLVGCAVLYTFAGTMGYCLYGHDVKSNFLLSLDRKQINEPLYYIMKICFLISVYIAYPIIFFGARNNSRSIYRTIRAKLNERKQENRLLDSQISQTSQALEEEDVEARRKRDSKEYYIFTFVLHVLITLFAIIFTDIEDVFNVIGAISASAINFWFPSIFYFQSVKKLKKEKKPRYYMSWALLWFFVPFGIFAVVSNYI